MVYKEEAPTHIFLMKVLPRKMSLMGNFWKTDMYASVKNYSLSLTPWLSLSDSNGFYYFKVKMLTDLIFFFVVALRMHTSIGPQMPTLSFCFTASSVSWNPLSPCSAVKGFYVFCFDFECHRYGSPCNSKKEGKYFFAKKLKFEEVRPFRGALAM